MMKLYWFYVLQNANTSFVLAMLMLTREVHKAKTVENVLVLCVKVVSCFRVNSQNVNFPVFLLCLCSPEMYTKPKHVEIVVVLCVKVVSCIRGIL